MTHKILIIDDDETLLEFLSAYLEEEGYKVIAAAGGPEGIRQAYAEHPDLIILDIMMPRLDGWGVAQRVREMSDVPMIMLSAKTAEHDKLRGFRLGIDDYVTKPFSFAELTARVTAILARVDRLKEKVARPVHYRVGELEIDLDSFQVHKRGELLQLTPTEFRLLRVLVENAGKALGEDRILSEVWGQSEDYTPGYVRRYIWYLRQKLEDDPSAPEYIHTERGFGYRFRSFDEDIPDIIE